MKSSLSDYDYSVFVILAGWQQCPPANCLERRKISSIKMFQLFSPKNKNKNQHFPTLFCKHACLYLTWVFWGKNISPKSTTGQKNPCTEFCKNLGIFLGTISKEEKEILINVHMLPEIRLSNIQILKSNIVKVGTENKLWRQMRCCVPLTQHPTPSSPLITFFTESSYVE